MRRRQSVHDDVSSGLLYVPATVRFNGYETHISEQQTS